MKTCTQCSKEKPKPEFYKLNRSPDGYATKCRECTKGNVKAHRIANLEKIREYDRAKGKLPHRLALNVESTRNSRQKSGYMAAHNAVARAVKKGVLNRLPCEMCGTELGVHAHHDDYSNRLDVMWLCVVHHKARHAFLDYIAQQEQEAA